MKPFIVTVLDKQSFWNSVTGAKSYAIEKHRIHMKDVNINLEKWFNS